MQTALFSPNNRGTQLFHLSGFIDNLTVRSWVFFCAFLYYLLFPLTLSLSGNRLACCCQPCLNELERKKRAKSRELKCVTVCVPGGRVGVDPGRILQTPTRWVKDTKTPERQLFHDFPDVLLYFCRHLTLLPLQEVMWYVCFSFKLSLLTIYTAENHEFLSESWKLKVWFQGPPGGGGPPGTPIMPSPAGTLSCASLCLC